MFQACVLLGLGVGLMVLLLWLLGEPQTCSASRQRFSPCLEGLEDRIAPSSVQSHDLNSVRLPLLLRNS